MTLSHILCKIFGPNQNIAFLFYSCFQQVLIQQVQLMILPEKKRKLHKRFLWVKVKRIQLEKLLNLVCNLETGLFYKIVSLDLNLWSKLNNLLLLSTIQKLKSLIKISDFGLLVNHTIDSPWVFFKKLLKLQMNHQKD